MINVRLTCTRIPFIISELTSRHCNHGSGCSDSKIITHAHTRANGTICRQHWMLRPNNNPLWLNWNSYLPDIIAISPPHQCHCNSRAQSKLLRWSAVSQSIMIISISVLSLFLRKYPTILFKTRASSEFSDSKLVMSRGVEETRYISIKYIFHICLVFLVC